MLEVPTNCVSKDEIVRPRGHRKKQTQVDLRDLLGRLLGLRRACGR